MTQYNILPTVLNSECVKLFLKRQTAKQTITHCLWKEEGLGEMILET